MTSTTAADAPSQFQAFNLRCTHPECTYKLSGIVTPEYANTLAVQHRFRYGHRVEVNQ